MLKLRMKKQAPDTKLAKKEKHVTSMDRFSVKKVGGDVFIEGWANKAVVDRGKDIIKMDAWNLENFKKVPMILFNHDKDKPIGRAVDVRATDGGLWIKAKLSRSSDPTISMVRDLVQEGILNAFSVGFDSQEEQKDEQGNNDIKKAELYEVSIVTLPMNQDSIFSMSSKTLGGLTRQEAICKVLSEKGAWVAEAVHGKIYEEERAGKSRDAILQGICKSACIDMDELTEVLAGNVASIPENILKAFADVLDMDEKELKKLEKGDQEVANEKECAPNNPEKKGMDIGVVGILVPKDVAESAEQAAQMVRDAGYDDSNIQDSEQGYFAIQADPAGFMEGMESQMDLGNGIIAIIGCKKPSDDAEAEVPPSEEEQKSEDKPEEESEMEDAEEKAEEPTDSKDDTTPIPAGNDGKQPADENPFLEQSRQTNVLLGVLIQEIRAMSQKLDGLAEQSVEEEASKSESEMSPEEMELAKSILTNIQEHLVDVETKIRKLGA